MTAAAITPAMAGADLLSALRELVQRHDGAESPQDVGKLLDDVSAALRRARGRVNRFAKRQAVEPEGQAAAKPFPAEPKPQPQEPPRPPEEAPETPPEPPRSRWPERLNTVALALVCAVIAPVIGVCAVGRGVARLARRALGVLSLRGER